MGFRKRMVALAVLIATAVVAALVVVSHVLLTRVTDADANALAHTRAEAVTANVTVRNGNVALLENDSEALDTLSWIYADGHLIDGIVPGSIRDRVQVLSDSTGPRTAVVDNQLLYAEPVRLDGHHVVAVVKVDLTPYDTSEQRSLTMSLLLSAIAVLLAGVVAYLGVGRALRVVHEMSARADDWGEHEPGRRFNLGEPRDEFGELGRTLDRLLDRLDEALADERRLTDEVAHELRTPLTALRGEAQLAQLSGDRLRPETVLSEVDRLTAAIATILGSARPRTDAGARCDLREALHRAVAARPIEVAVPSRLEVAVAPDLVVAVLSPLLDNALRHSISRVQIKARPADGNVVVDVLDDGPGFSPSQVDRVFNAGVSGGNGHGLGLAVVRRLADSAAVSVAAIADGQGHVEVTFPTPQRSS
ncbi:sensor histidine kinase [Calidifontibacter terrae]